MAWADMALDGTLSLAQNVGSFIIASKQRKLQKKWQDYNNKLTRLQNAQNQNALTTNAGMAVERSAEQSFQIEKSEYITTGQAEAAAAASGTTGRSVNLVLGEISRNAASAQARRAQDLTYELMGIDEQKKASQFNTEMQIDHTTIPSASPASALLGFTSDMVTSWKNAGKPSFSFGGGVARTSSIGSSHPRATGDAGSGVNYKL